VLVTTAKSGDDQGQTISRLAARGESTLSRIAELPGGTKALQAFNDLRDRVDDLGRKVRGIDALEARVAKLEKEIAALKRAGKQKPTTARKSTRKSSPTSG
jgi:hypothetical protein